MKRTEPNALTCWVSHTKYRKVYRTEKPEGITHIFDHTDASPGEEQLTAYSDIIRSLRDLSYECFVISFIETDRDDKHNTGLAYYQMYATDGGLLHVEIGIPVKASPCLGKNAALRRRSGLCMK